MNATVFDSRIGRRLVLAACLVTYVPAVAILSTFQGVVLGPLSVLPVLVAAWAYGVRGGVLTALALAPFHVYVAVQLRGEEPLSVSLFLNTVHVAVGAAFGYLFERVRAALRVQRECEDRYERAARGANDGLIEWDLSRGTMYFSERFCEMLGYGRKQLRGHVDEWFGHVHPEDLADLRAALVAHRAGESARLEHEHRLRGADGGYLWVHVRGVLTHGDDGELLTAWTTDVSARKQAEHELRFHAFRDPLTGLPNRSLFMDRLAQALLRLRDPRMPAPLPSLRPLPDGDDSRPVQTAERGPHVAVLLIDLDRFKRVNDSLGHTAGDGLLLAVADRLRACVRREDTVARLGGDEFALLLEHVAGPHDAIEVAERVRAALLEPVIVKGRAVSSGCSIGIVVTEKGEDSPADLVRDADTAMYRGKAAGRGQWALFDPSMRERAVERLTLENELRTALANGQLEVLYQPIVDAGGNFAGFEALPRWHNARLGTLYPGDFIALAEETGLIMELGDFVLAEACDTGRRLLAAVGDVPFTAHVNLSPKQIRRPDLLARIEAILMAAGFDPARLCVEVTEDVILEQLPTGTTLFDELRDKGVKLCMDDFGTGYSSLAYLHRFRVDYLKIEAAFVQGAEARESGVQIVRSLVNLAKNLGVVAVAEGVETERQWTLLHALGCPRAQGFFIAHPLSAADLVHWVTQRSAACA